MYVNRLNSLAFPPSAFLTQGTGVFIEKLPEPILLAMRQSGIIEQGGDYAWLNDSRIVAALLFAHEAHGGKVRKYGGEIRLIHEIWCAHQVYQICKHPQIARKLAKEGVDPIEVVFGVVIHDCIENSPIPAKIIISALAKIWGDAKSFARLQVQGLDYMSDEDPVAPNELRIPKQRAKGFVDGVFSLSTMLQLLRMVDKTHHVFADARYCIKQAEYLRQNGTQEKWDNLRKLAGKRLQRAKEKSFIIGFPLGWIVEPSYRRSQEILARTARGYHDPAPAPMLNSAHLAGKVVMSRLERFKTSALQMAMRHKKPNFAGLRSAFASLTL